MEPNLRSFSMLRAADAMLFALGGSTVTLRLPGAPVEHDPRAGLRETPAEEVEVGPAVVRRIADVDGRRRLEVLVSATALRALADLRNSDTPEVLLATALGVVRDAALLRIERVDTDIFAGAAYLYRLIVFSFPEVTTS